MPRWLPLFLKGGREKLVGRHYYADRKVYHLQENMAQNDINTFPRPTGEGLRERGLSAYDEILKRVQDDRVVSETHSKELNVLTSYRLNGFKKKAAFTLAEVLITLAIIGIVAALTIPTLITNYQKKQTASKLKQAYSIISQALTMAQAEHGDTTTWEVAGIYGTPTDDANFNHKDALTKFAAKYFIPYLKVSEDFGYKKEQTVNYDGPYNPVTNNYALTRGSFKYRILLSNNILISVGIGTSGCIGGTNPDGSCVSIEYRNIIFEVDINGFEKPNTLGKDVFYMTFDLRKKVFGFHNYGIMTRQRYLDSCKSDGATQICGYLIFLDGWEIKDDYPWF